LHFYSSKAYKHTYKHTYTHTLWILAVQGEKLKDHTQRFVGKG